MWKQAAAVWPAKRPLLCFYSKDKEEGWWFCDRYWSTVADRRKMDDIHIAAYASPSVHVPTAVHVPFWRTKKAVVDIAIVPIMDWYEQQIEQLSMAVVEVESTKGSGGGSSGGDGGGGEFYANKGGDGDDGDGGGRGHNNKGGKAPNRGGWMPRVSVLIAQVMQKQWREVRNTVWKWYEEYPLLKKLVDKDFKEIKSGRSTIMLWCSSTHVAIKQDRYTSIVWCSNTHVAIKHDQ